MKFKYKKYSKTHFRPIIPVEIVWGGSKIRYEVLVDSGADLCIFDSQIADILGIDLKKGAKEQVIGVTGVPQDYYLHTVTLKVGGREYKAEVGFTDISRQSYGIVGQKGFFDSFIVKFDLSKEEIDLKPKF